MKKSILLYLLIFSVLTNLFTYMYFTKKTVSAASEDAGVKSDSIPIYKENYNVLYNKYLDVYPFTLEGNQNAQDYFEDKTTGKYIPFEKLEPLVKQKLISFNDNPNGNPYVDQVPMSDQKFIINSALLLNHRWIIANYSNGEIWGDVLIKYYVDKNDEVTFETMQSWIYPK